MRLNFLPENVCDTASIRALSKWSTVGLVGMVLFGAQATGQAEVLYSQVFDTPMGGIPTGWTLASGFAGAQGVASISTVGSRTGFYQARTGTATGNSYLYLSATNDNITNGILDDFSTQIVFGLTGGGSSNERGVMIRAQGTGYETAQGYYVTVNPVTSVLRLRLNPGTATSPGTLLTSVDLGISLGTTANYMMEITAVGYTISANIYGWSGITESYSVELGGFEYLDENETYASGRLGFRSSFTTNTSSPGVVWQSINIAAIPEPSSMAAVVGGLVFLTLRRRKKGV